MPLGSTTLRDMPAEGPGDVASLCKADRDSENRLVTLQAAIVHHHHTLIANGVTTPGAVVSIRPRIRLTP